MERENEARAEKKSVSEKKWEKCLRAPSMVPSLSASAFDVALHTHLLLVVVGLVVLVVVVVVIVIIACSNLPCITPEYRRETNRLIYLHNIIRYIFFAFFRVPFYMTQYCSRETHQFMYYTFGVCAFVCVCRKKKIRWFPANLRSCQRHGWWRMLDAESSMEQTYSY